MLPKHIKDPSETPARSLEVDKIFGSWWKYLCSLKMKATKVPSISQCVKLTICKNTAEFFEGYFM
jgi:hypothetical protein